jgi:hypothetical protein
MPKWRSSQEERSSATNRSSDAGRSPVVPPFGGAHELGSDASRSVGARCGPSPPKVVVVSDAQHDDNEDTRCERCQELVAEVRSLLGQVAELRARNLELLRAAVQRDYERPPHY